MSNDFQNEELLILQPGDDDVSYTFSFPPASAVTENDGAIPFGTTIASAVVTAKRQDTGVDATAAIVQSTSNTTTTVTNTLSYPTVMGVGTYYLKFVLTINTGAKHEFDYIIECIDKPLSEFLERVKLKVKDVSDSDSPSGKLVYPTDYIACTNEALAKYSSIYPRVIVEEITGNGTYDYTMPTSWVENFSEVVTIEFPVGEKYPSYLENDEYMIYRDLQGIPLTEVDILRLFTITPSISQKFRLTYTAIYTTETLPAKHVDAVNNLAAGFCCELLATYYAHTSKPLITADSVNYLSKSKEFAQRAAGFYALYKELLGMSPKDIVPASGLDFDWDFGLSDQHETSIYLTHSNRR